MKLILTIYFYVATLMLPSIIYGRTLMQYSNDVDAIAAAGGVINGIFEPLAGGHLGMGSFAFVYLGILRSIKQQEIAMKFTTPEKKYLADKEYQMYSYLGAINDTNVEQYGIPVIYYYGECSQTGLILMAISLLDQDIQDLTLSKQLFEHDVNILILLRNFILSSKYIHSKGIRHDDIKLENIMLRKHRSFVIDFNIGSKMNQKSISGSFKFLSRAGHRDGVRYPKDDWESFLYSVCTTLGVKFKWIGLRSDYRVFKLKSNTTNTLALIETIQSKTLRNVLREFAQHIFDDGGPNEKSDGDIFFDARPIDKFASESDSEQSQTDKTFHLCNEKRFPDYNHWYKLVDDKIKKSNSPKPAMFTWLTPEQRNEAINDLKKHPIPDIMKMDEPKDCDYSAMKYPDADTWKPTSSSRSSQSFALAESFTGSNKKISKISSGSKSKSKASYYTCSDGSESRK